MQAIRRAGGHPYREESSLTHQTNTLIRKAEAYFESLEKEYPLNAQLQEWLRFCALQSRNRKYYVPRKRFAQFEGRIMARRQKHGLHIPDSLSLLVDGKQQNAFQTWIEYQDFELQGLDALELKLCKQKQELAELKVCLASQDYASSFAQDECRDTGDDLTTMFAYSTAEGKAEKEYDDRAHKLGVAQRRQTVAKSLPDESVSIALWNTVFELELKKAREELQKKQTSLLPDARYSDGQRIMSRTELHEALAVEVEAKSLFETAQQAVRLAAQELWADVSRTALVATTDAEVCEASQYLAEASSKLERARNEYKFAVISWDIKNLERRQHLRLGLVEWSEHIRISLSPNNRSANEGLSNLPCKRRKAAACESDDHHTSLKDEVTMKRRKTALSCHGQLRGNITAQSNGTLDQSTPPTLQRLRSGRTQKTRQHLATGSSHVSDLRPPRSNRLRKQPDRFVPG